MAPEQLELAAAEESVNTDEVQQLIAYFHHRFHGLRDVAPTPKAYGQAQKLIAEYGLKQAKFIVDYVDQHKSDIWIKPHHFGFILSYAPQAMAEYEKHQVSQEKYRVRLEQEVLDAEYQYYREQQVADIRAHISTDELDKLRSDIQNSFDQNNTPLFGRTRLVEIEIDKALEQRYCILSFEAWREQRSGANR